VLGVAAVCYLVGLTAIILPEVAAALASTETADVALGKSLPHSEITTG
jgi:hypothetical protein